MSKLSPNHPCWDDTDEPMFVMSLFASQLELHRAKSEWYQKAHDVLKTKNQELEDRLVIDTLNPNRRKHICDLQARILELEEAIIEDGRHPPETETLLRLDADGYEEEIKD